MVSIFYVHKSPLREAYNRMLKGCGYDSRRFGKGEWELKDLVKPSRSVFVASYDRGVDERLEHMRERAYSGQWDIPEDVNEKVVKELKRQFAGKVFHQELRLLIWDIDHLKAFCEKT